MHICWPLVNVREVTHRWKPKQITPTEDPTNTRARSRSNHNKNLENLKFLLLRSRGKQMKVEEERNKQRSIKRQGRQTLLSCLLEVVGRMLTLLVARRRPSAHMTSTLPMGSTANLSNVVTLSFNTG